MVATVPMPTDHRAKELGLLTLAEAAKVLDIRELTLKRWVAAGRIQTVLLGQRTLIPIQEVVRFYQPALDNENTRMAAIRLIEDFAASVGIAYYVEADRVFPPEQLARNGR